MVEPRRKREGVIAANRDQRVDAEMVEHPEDVRGAIDARCTLSRLIG
jgi:hypothetical protein